MSEVCQHPHALPRALRRNLLVSECLGDRSRVLGKETFRRKCGDGFAPRDPTLVAAGFRFAVAARAGFLTSSGHGDALLTFVTLASEMRLTAEGRAVRTTIDRPPSP